MIIATKKQLYGSCVQNCWQQLLAVFSPEIFNLKAILFSYIIYKKRREVNSILTISEKLEVVLKRLDINQRELADKLGTSQPNLSKKFKYNDWRESDVKEICAAIGVECETIFRLDDGTIV